MPPSSPAVSDDSGKYSLNLPGPGTYTAKLQVGSLPKGVRLTDTKKTQLTVEVSEGRRRAIIFPFGKGIAGPAGALDRLPGTLLDGVRLGLIIAMTAIGLSLIYGTTQFTNFAHGEMVTFGALVTWFLNHDGGLPVLWSALIAALALGGVAVAGYQTWMQAFPHLVTECGYSDPSLIERLVDWLGMQWPGLFLATGFCTSREWEFLGLSMANWSLVVFFGIAGYAGLLFGRKG